MTALFEFATSPVQQQSGEQKTWRATSGKLLQAIKGVGGIKEISAGTSLSNLISQTETFTSWRSLDGLKVDGITLENDSLGFFQAKGNFLISFSGQNNIMLGWAATINDVELTIPYLQVAGQVRLAFTTNDKEYPGQAVYAVTPGTATGESITLTGVGLIDNLQLGATIKKLVFSRDNQSKSIVINSAVLVGRLDVSESDILAINSDIEISYLRSDKKFNNNTTLTVAEAEIKSGELRTWFSGALKATDVVLLEADKSKGLLNKWELLKARLSGNLAVNFDGLVAGTATATIQYEKANNEPGLNGQPTITLESAKLALNDPSQKSLSAVIGQASVEVRNLLMTQVSSVDGLSSHWQAQSFQASVGLSLAPDSGFKIEGQADISWKRRDSACKNAETLRINQASISTDTSSGSQWNQYFTGSVTATDVVFSKVLETNGNRWQAESFTAAASLKVLPETIKIDSQAQVSWRRQDLAYTNAETLTLDKASFKIGDVADANTLGGLLDAQVEVNVSNLVLKSIPAPDGGQATWQVQRFKAAASASAQALQLANFSVNGGVDLVWQRSDSSYQGAQSLVITQATLNGAFDFAAAGATARNVVLTQAAGEAVNGGWQVQEFTVKADSTLNVPGLSLNGELSDLIWRRSDPEMGNQQTLRISNANLTTELTSGMFAASAEARDVLLIRDKNGAWTAEHWTAVGTINLDTEGFDSNATATLKYQKINNAFEKRQTYTVSEAVLNTAIQPGLTAGLLQGQTAVTVNDLVLAGDKTESGLLTPLSWKANATINLKSNLANGISVEGAAALSYNLSKNPVNGATKGTYTISRANLAPTISGGAFTSTLEVQDLVIEATPSINRLEQPITKNGIRYEYQTPTGELTKIEQLAYDWKYEPLQWTANGNFKLSLDKLVLNGSATISYKKYNPSLVNKETYQISNAAINLTGSQLDFFKPTDGTAPPSISVTNTLLAKNNGSWQVESFNATGNLGLKLPGFAAEGNADIGYLRQNPDQGNSETFTIRSAAIDGTLEALTKLDAKISANAKAENIILSREANAGKWNILGYTISGDIQFKTEAINVNGNISLQYSSKDKVYDNAEVIRINQASLAIDPSAGLGALLDASYASIGVSDVVLVKKIGQELFTINQITAQGRVKFADQTTAPINVDASASVTYRRQDADNENRETWTINSAILKANGALSGIIAADTDLQAKNVVLSKNETGDWQVLRYDATAKIKVDINDKQLSAGADGEIQYRFKDSSYSNRESFTIVTAGLNGALNLQDSAGFTVSADARVNDLVLLRTTSLDQWVPQQFAANGNLNLTTGSLKLNAKGTFEYRLENQDELVDNKPATTYQVKDTSLALNLTNELQGITVNAQNVYIVNGVLKDIDASVLLNKFSDVENVKLSLSTRDNNTATDDTNKIYFSLAGTWKGNNMIATLPVKFENGEIGPILGFDAAYINPTTGASGSFSISQTGISDESFQDYAYTGPLSGARIFLDKRTYDTEGKLLAPSDLRQSSNEPFTITSGTGGFNLDLLAKDTSGKLKHDANLDGTIDFKDGMQVLLPSPSLIEPITGLPLLVPLVGIPNGYMNVMTTLKYSSVLRMSGDSKYTPEYITSIFANKLENVPQSFIDDDYPAYLALTTAQTPELQREAAKTIEFTYQYLYLVQVIKGMFDNFGLIYEEPVGLWDRAITQPALDQEGVDQPGLVAYSALGSAILNLFGENASNGINPTDEFSRTAIANKFNPLNSEHVRAVIREVLSLYPTEKVFAAFASHTSQSTYDRTKFYSSNRRSTNNIESQLNKQLHQDLEKDFGNFMTSVSSEIVHDLLLLRSQFELAQNVSDNIPTLGNELTIPAIAGLKRTLYNGLANRVIEEGLERNQQSTTFAASTSTDKAAVVLTIDDTNRKYENFIRLLTPTIRKSGNRYLARFDVEIINKLNQPVLPPSYGLTVRLQLGGSAEQNRDYFVADEQRFGTFFIEPGVYNGSFEIEINPLSLVTADYALRNFNKTPNLQVRLLNADSGYAIAEDFAVATLALIRPDEGSVLATDAVKVADMASFASNDKSEVLFANNHWIHRVNPYHSNQSLKATKDSIPNQFVLTRPLNGLPVIEGFNAERGDSLVWSDPNILLSDLAVVAGLAVNSKTGEAFALINGASSAQQPLAIGAIFHGQGSVLDIATPQQRGDIRITAKNKEDNFIKPQERLQLTIDPGFDRSFAAANDAYEIIALVKDDSDSIIRNAGTISLYSQIGNDYGDPKQYDRYHPRVITLPSKLSDATIELQIRGTRHSTTLPLSITAVSDRDNEFHLLLDGKTIGTLNTQGLEALPELFAEQATYGTTEADTEDKLTGYSLETLGAPYSDQDRWIEITLDLYRESRYNNKVGFALVSRNSGDVLDPLTGTALASINSPDYLNILAGNSVFAMTGNNNNAIEVSGHRFKVGGNLNLSDVLMIPFIASEGESKFIATSSKAINGGYQQIQWSDRNTMCFEDLRRGSKDFDDAIIVLKEMTIHATNF